MARAFTPKVITANRLLEGDAVWLTAAGDWSGRMGDALLIEDEQTAQAKLALAQTMPHLIVGAYLVEAVQTANGPAPTHFRETFRTRGPSNYQHGKQVQDHV